TVASVLTLPATRRAPSTTCKMMRDFHGARSSRHRRASLGSRQGCAMDHHDHTAKAGRKFADRCSVPLASKRRLDLMVTKLAVIEACAESLLHKKTTPGDSWQLGRKLLRRGRPFR